MQGRKKTRRKGVTDENTQKVVLRYTIFQGAFPLV